MRSTRRRLLAALLTASTVSCTNRVQLAERHVALGRQPVVLHFAEPYQARGPTRELCLEFEAPRDLRAVARDEHNDLESQIVAVLLRTSGARDTMGLCDEGPSLISGSGRHAAPAIDIEGDREVCLWDHGLANTANAKLVRYTYDDSHRVIGSQPPQHPLPPLTASYVGVELRSATALRVRRVSFWAGQRAASP